MNKSGQTFSRWISVLSGTVALVLAAVSVTTPAVAMSGALEENLAGIRSVAQAGFSPASPQLPVVESVVGRGQELSTDPETRVGVGPVTNGSVLARVTVWSPEQDTEVFTSQQATPVLFAPGGRSVSTTTLLPVHEGSVSLFASNEVNYRLEVLAELSGSALAPGSTIALDVPVTRADTRANVGASSLSENGLWVGLLGQGGVPAEAVRSVYATVSLDFPAPADVLIDDQRVSLPAGRSVVTTVVSPDAAGGIRVSLYSQTGGVGAGFSGDLRLDVLGWVPESQMDVTAVNVTGGFVPASEADVFDLSGVSSARTHVVDMADHADISYVLALVSSDAATEHTAVSWSDGRTARTAGIALEPGAGAIAQLALIPAAAEQSRFGVGHGAADVRVWELGGFLSAQSAPNSLSDLTKIHIQSPTGGSHLDVSESASFELAGRFEPGTRAVERIEVSSPEVGFIGFAEVDYSGDELKWSFAASAPRAGEVQLDVAVFERGESQAVDSQSVVFTVDVPDASDTVTNEDIVLLDTAANMPLFTVRGATDVVFSAQPPLEAAQILVSGITPGSPEGFLGRVQSIDVVGGEWIVRTSPVSLEEYIYQADIEVISDYGDGSDLVMTDTSGDAPLEGSTYVDESGELQSMAADFSEVVPGSESSSEILTGEEVDVDHFTGSDSVTREPGDRQEPVGSEITETGEWDPGVSAGDPPLNSQVGATFDSTYSFSLAAKLLVKLTGQAPEVANHTAQTTAEFMTDAKNEMEHRAAIALNVKAQADLRTVVVLRVAFKPSWKVWKTRVTVNEFTVKLGTKLKGEASVLAFAEVHRNFGIHKKIAHTSLPSFTVPVGPVPVIITNEIDFTLGIQVDGSASVEIPVLGASREDWFGFTYTSDRGIARIKEDPKITSPEIKFLAGPGNSSVQLDASVAVGPELTYSQKIYSLAGPAFSFSALAGLEGSVSVNPAHPTRVHAEFDVFLKLGLNGTAKLTLLGFEILNLQVFRLEWKTKLYEREFEFDPFG